MSETIIIVAIVCIAALGGIAIVAISTYKRDKLEFLSTIQYKDVKNQIAITSTSDEKDSKK